MFETVTLSRDDDPATRSMAGMSIGSTEPIDDPQRTVAAWFAAGVRHVELPSMVDVTDEGAATVRALVLVRELTSYGIAVQWRLRLAGDGTDWQVYSHLYPPAELSSDAAEDPLPQWRRTFYLDKCAYRRGPGFVQVRDRRSGQLNLLTIDDPAYLEVLEAVLGGAPLTAVDLDVARAYSAEGLVTLVGDTLLWLPYRLRRWPLPSMIV